MAAPRHCPSWADLQPELLGLVLRRLTSLADRVRLAAVCRSWRHSASLEPLPPPFPWLILRDGTFLSILDGKIYRLSSSIPSENYPRCYGSVGNWLFLRHHTKTGGGGPLLLSLMNPFSGDVIRLPDVDTIWRHKPVDRYPAQPILFKMVLLSSMDLSSDSLFAVLITDCCFESVISICRPSVASAFRVPDHERVSDVALVDGKLYALSARKLFVLEVESTSDKCKPKLPSMKCIANDAHNSSMLRKTIAGEEYICGYWDYLVESSGKLLHVRRLLGCLPVHAFSGENRVEYTRTFSFDVFEVDLTTSSSVQWRQLNSLGGQALFVGPSSKALQAFECGAQADCIYFMCDYDWGNWLTDPFRDSGVFNMRNNTITPLLPQAMLMHETESCTARPSWFFPY